MSKFYPPQGLALRGYLYEKPVYAVWTIEKIHVKLYEIFIDELI